MRHAKSSWKHPELEDHARPLNKRGRLSAKAIASELVRLDWAPTLIISSDSTRTRETWAQMEIVLEHTPVTFHRSLYHAGWDAATIEVSSQSEGEGTILLLGHNPGWSWMVDSLTGRPTELKTADAALLEPKDDKGWIELMTLPGQWKFAHLLRSRTLLEYADLY